MKKCSQREIQLGNDRKSNRFCKIVVILLSLSLAPFSLAHAAQGQPPKPQPVQVAATDGLMLKGDYYTLQANLDPESGASAILVLHGLNGNRQDEIALVQPLLQDGYQVLLVDQRGFGETGGQVDWEAAVGDVRTWLNWLKHQPNVRPNGLAIIGDGIGSNVALIACNSDPDCATTVALSPSLVDCDTRNCQSEVTALGQPAVDFFVRASKEAIAQAAEHHSLLLIGSQLDSAAKSSIRQIVSLSQNEVGLWLSSKDERGREFLYGPDAERVISLISLWLNDHIPADHA